MSLHNEIVRIFAKAMPILLQPESNNFDRYAELLWTLKSVGHTCTEAGDEKKGFE